MVNLNITDPAHALYILTTVRKLNNYNPAHLQQYAISFLKLRALYNKIS